MKLNNRGWGLQAMLAGVLVLMIALVIIAVLVNKTFGDIMPSVNDENNYDNVNQDIELKYSELEDKVLEAAKTYQKRYFNDISDGEIITVSIKKLQERGLINNITDIKDPNISCTGYATFKKQDDIIYNAYIKCGSNYQTVGYQNYE